MAYITVVPESKLIMVDTLPIVIEDCSYPDGVVCLYFDTHTKKGNRQSSDPTTPLVPIEYADIKPFHDAHKRAAKKIAKTPSSRNVEQQSEPESEGN